MKKNARGLYQKQITITVNGVKKQKAFYGKTMAEINKKLLEYKGEIEKGRLFEDVAEEWWEEHQKTITYGTAKSYKAPKNRLVAHFNNKYIRDIMPNDIDCCIKEFAQKGYAQKTVKNLLLVANLIFSYAVTKNHITLCPTTHIKIPKNLSKKKRELPSDSDIKAVKENVNYPFGLFAFFLLYTGLRKGEALALQYKDIDRTSKTINVYKSVYYISNDAIIKEPKTEAGKRSVVLLEPLLSVLKNGKKDDFIFSTDGTKPLSAKSFIVKWSKYTKSIGISITPHQLRHAYATRLYELGIDEKAAQDLLGHANISTTHDIYTHISESKRKSIGEQLQEF